MYAPTGSTTPGPPVGLAVGAMVLAVLALLVAWVPFIGVLGLLGGIAGLVLGIVARRRVSAGRAGGGGMALAGIIIGAVAILFGLGSTALTVVIIRSATWEGPGWEYEASWNLDPEEAGDGLGATNDSLGETTDSLEDTGYGLEDTDEGLRLDDRLTDGELAMIEGYGTVNAGQTAPVGDNGRTGTVLSWDLAADERIMAVDGMHPREGDRYVWLEIELANDGPDPYQASELDISLLGGDLRLHRNECRWNAPTTPVHRSGEIRTGEAVTVDVCFDVPDDAVPEARLIIRDFEAFRGPALVWEIE
ncbi:hypothetical protein N869_14170 [Cellulomonas bogoriensis 69B4 = DSM 16987]|uniref:DUF4190 domain-containing protein n=1 Tax=Cellulomonas bogoriensis 69B4 = DSM 16987 TaxID=1386082 RepID=A0A0A0C1Z7_9CELL|nr:hypothetical protein N869_14170 [Cellulomonas bogoriensis 69B4 = DSM 16987]